MTWPVPPATWAVRTGWRAWWCAATSAAAHSASPPPTWRRFRYTAVPSDGVYAGWLIGLDDDGREEECWPAAVSVGSNPTFDGRDRTVEAYALDRDDLDLYGRHMAVDFAARLRGMVRFDSAEALIEQMRQDVDQAREQVGGAHERAGQRCLGPGPEGPGMSAGPAIVPA